MFGFLKEDSRAPGIIGIERMLTGEEQFTLVTDFLRFQPITEGRMCAYTPGGFYLLSRHVNAFFLDLDRSLSQNIETEQMRGQILELVDRLEAAGKLAAPVVPLGNAALWRGVGGRRTREALKNMHAVHRDGLEAVFRIRPWTPPGMPPDQDNDHFYLSAYDSQESPPLYFMCRLPHPAFTVADAREALKPESVKKAEARGLEVKRQGDLFAIATSKTMHDFGQKIQVYGPYLTQSALTELEHKGFYGTAHTATHSAQLPNGMWLGSGIMYHNPYLVGEKRQADHSPLVLGDGAWFITKNTVPISGPASARPRIRW